MKEATNWATGLHRRIVDRDACVGILGLGYMGLPLALACAEAGFVVLGFDTDDGKVKALERGECYISHLAVGRLATVRAAGRFAATSDFNRLPDADCLLICVPTPLNRNREPDLSYVDATAREIQPRLRPGQLVVLESTSYPGTTDERLRGLLETSGMSCGEEFFLASSPEREDPGNPRYTAGTIPKVVGGVDEVSGELAETLYRQVVGQVVRVSTARTAEATKLLENIFRSVNIALVNELKALYDRMGVDVWEVLDAAETKPFGFLRFNPGPGWGGHCIPVDPFYLSWKAREYGVTARFIELAGEINREMPRYVLEKLQRALNARGKPLSKSRVLVLGLAYKKDVADPRESPAFEILHQLQSLGARVSYHDPLLPRSPRMRSWPELPEMTSVPLDEEVLAAQDAVLVVTDHGGVDYDLVLEKSALVIDTRGVYPKGRGNLVQA